MANIRKEAERLRDAGLSVIPIAVDGSKSPAAQMLPLDPDTGRHTWAPYHTRLATDDELARWFDAGRLGIGIVAGAISGNLEVLDFDDPDTFTEWAELLDSLAPGLLERLPCVETPSRGRHLYYRCATIAGNLKLARTVDEAGAVETLIETRGEHGYVVAPGSPIHCHPLQRTYEVLDGDLTDIPPITPDERDMLHSAARTFNRYMAPERVYQAPAPDATPHDGERPGEAFARRTSWGDVLRPHGWTFLAERGGVGLWKRPGKDGPGPSATTNHAGSDLLYVFSSNAAPFEAERGYSKFTAYCLLEHRGDFAAAARALGSQGFGAPPRRPRLVTTPAAAEAPMPDQDLPALDLPFGDVYNAALLAHHYGAILRYCERLGGWLIWNGTHWAHDDIEQVMELARDTLRWALRQCPSSDVGPDGKVIPSPLAAHLCKSLNNTRLVHMLKQAQSWPGIACSSDVFDRDPWLLNCANGILDLRTASLQPHDQGAYITKCLRVAYDPAATAPTWQSFLARVMGGDAKAPIEAPPNQRAARLRGFLQRAMGYALTGMTGEECLFVLYGTGRNGKSKFLGACQELLADYAKTAQMSSFLHQDRETIRNDLADLQGVRLVSAIEASAGTRFSEGLVKQLTGGDRLKARFLFHEYFEFLPAFKLFLAFNAKPEIRGTDPAIWERIRMVPFDVYIPAPERDKQLGDKLRAELPGILAWAVEGCLAWQRDGLQEPPEVIEATADYRAEMDRLAEFLAECCLVGPGLRVASAELYEAYERWCEGDQTPLTKNMFGRELTSRGFAIEVGSRNRKWRIGLALLKGEGD